MYTNFFKLFWFFCYGFCSLVGAISPNGIELGIDRLFQEKYKHLVAHKRVGLITNHTGISSTYVSTANLFEAEHGRKTLTLVALFAPEHGFYGDDHAGEKVSFLKTRSGVPIFSLHGETRRPTANMLRNIDVLVYDVQDIGSRSYTFISTLFYVMEEAAKAKIPVVVLDRPNPLGGMFVDGPMLQEAFRSFVGYVNIPYCHGMTVGELATFFNGEYHIGCHLEIVPMKGYTHSLQFMDTGLPWIPTSPNIPDATSAFFYPTTGIIGELSVASIGIGSSLAFKVVVAPWIDGQALAAKLNKKAPPGIHFQPFRMKPYAGSFVGKSCDGILLMVTNWKTYNPIATMYWIIDGLKQLYPQVVSEKLESMSTRLPFFYRICGCREIYEFSLHERAPYQKLRALHAKERAEFMKIRKKYLFAEYKTSCMAKNCSQYR